MEGLNLTFKVLNNYYHKFERKRGSLSQIMVLGTPLPPLHTTCEITKSASYSTLTSVVVGTHSAILLNLSTTPNIAS